MTQQEYIITEEQLRELEQQEISVNDVIRLDGEIRSRPAANPIPDDEQCRICEQAVRQDEREKVLDELAECFLQDSIIYEGAFIHKTIESLRRR